VTLWRESTQRREDAERELAYRREQYLVESSTDLATRVWRGMRRAESLEAEKTVPWEEVYEVLLDLQMELVGEAPRYRLARVEAASGEISTQLSRYLLARAVAQGMAEADRTFYRIMLEGQATDGTPATRVKDDVRAEVGFDEADLDRAIELFRREAFKQTLDQVGQVLREVSQYQPGQPFKLVEKNREPYPDFDELWTSVKKQAMEQTDRLAVESGDQEQG